MKQIHVSAQNTLALGRQGENLARQVVFDLSEWAMEYGDGTAELIVQRPGEKQPYPAAIDQNGASVVWPLMAADTALASNAEISDGYCELRWYVGDVLAKSKTWRTWVEKAMDTPTTDIPPKTEQGWVDQILAAGAAAKASADSARVNADRAETARAEAEKAQNLAEQAAAQAGYMQFEIDENGHLIYSKTDNVPTDFALKNGGLIQVCQ